LRYQLLDRLTLPRRTLALDVDGRSVGLKAVSRGAAVTVKAEADHIASVAGGRAARDGLRQRVEDLFRRGADEGDSA
ncbi:MAG: hypothetical protein KDI01_04295, partial [Halioglobus sp.]|nr:hypothetical protein [Halioglobus sp.]